MDETNEQPTAAELVRRAMLAQGKYDPDAAIAAAPSAIPPDDYAVAEQAGDWRSQMPEAEPVELSEAERAMIQPSLLEAPDDDGVVLP